MLKTAAGEIGAIEFIPSLRQKQPALDLIEAGSVVRVVLRLRERFWSPDYEALSFLHTADPDFPTWWTAYPLREPMLVGWCGGPRARELSELGADALQSRAITSLARRCAARGVAVVLIEHDVEMVMNLCDHLYALDFGRLIASGRPAEMRISGAVRSAYLGVAASP